MNQKPFALASIIVGALILLLAWIYAWQTGLVPPIAVNTVGGAMTGVLLWRVMRGRR